MKGNLLIERDAGNTTGNIFMRNGSGTQRVFVQYGLFGMRSLAIGANAGPASLATASADGCIYIGNESGRLTTSNRFNTFLGYRSGYNIGNIDNSNTFVGGQSAFNITGGNDNLIQGFNSALSVIRGDRNVMLGSKTVAFGMSTGNDNITIGAGSSLIETSSNQNIIIGSNAQGRDFNFPGALTNAVTIGNLGMVDCSNCFTIGSQNPFTSPEQQVGIGYRNPAITVIPPPPLPLAPPPPPASPAKLYVSNFNGGTTSAFLNGDVYTPAMYFPSDSALKTNIQTYSNALQVITSLEVKSYEFNHSAFPSMVLPSGNQVGIMATNINSLAPQLVRMFSNPIEYDTTGNIINPQVDFAAVNYTGIIPYLVSAIKEQKHTIDSLISVVSLCCPAPDIPDPSNRNQSSIKLSNTASIILNQNVPNPFKDKTEITYEIPTEVNKAAILFYDASGKILNTFEITGSGSGTLTVYGDDLSSGIYTYTLIVDGKPIQTKKMVKE